MGANQLSRTMCMSGVMKRVSGWKIQGWMGEHVCTQHGELMSAEIYDRGRYEGWVGGKHGRCEGTAGWKDGEPRCIPS